MNIITKLIKIILLIILLTTFILIIIALFNKKILLNSDTQTVVGSLAVIAATLSTWSAIKVIELTIENKKPKIIVRFNFERHILLQLEIINIGGSIAKNLSFKWNNPPTDEGKDLIFPENETIKYIATEEKIIRLMGRMFAFPEQYNFVFTGKASYQDLKNNWYHDEIFLDLSKYEKTMTITNDTREYYEIMKDLPKKVDELNKTIKNFTKISKPDIHKNDEKDLKTPDVMVKNNNLKDM